VPLLEGFMRYIKNTDTGVLFEVTPILEKEVERRHFSNLIFVEIEETADTPAPADTAENKRRGKKE